MGGKRCQPQASMVGLKTDLFTNFWVQSVPSPEVYLEWGGGEEMKKQKKKSVCVPFPADCTSLFHRPILLNRRYNRVH